MSTNRESKSRRYRLPPAQVAARARFVFLGAGSVGRETVMSLFRLGGDDFLLVDPKSYTESSVRSQCQPSEVGRPKVDVQADWLRERGAMVATYARDLSTLPEGLLGDQTIVIASLDNRHADIVANRWASRMRVRFVKINVEPQFGIAAVRCYDFRRFPELCVECQFSQRMYAEQWHPQSCDAPARTRSTNSPRWLSRAAGGIGAAAILDLAAGGAAALRWLHREVQWSPSTSQLTESELTPRTTCHWNHRQHWRNLVRCDRGPHSLTLREAIAAAGIGAAPTRVRTCHPISLRARCAQCGQEIRSVRWLPDLNHSTPPCPRCGGVTGAIPFWNATEIELRQLQHVLDQPLGSWGVEPCAVFQFHRGHRAGAVVVGPDDGPQKKHEQHATR